jgi:hypothetical protein
MVEFLTLLAGLVLGVQTIEVAVAGPVARVELQLDGELLAELDGPPWIARCDFGTAPRPARLTALAYDGDGGELDRDEQWVNLPGEPVDAEIVELRDPDGEVVSARITWSSPEFERPNRITVELDGREMRVRPPYRIDLTGLPERKVHVLTAELRFSPEVVIRRELVFGHDIDQPHDTGLTATAVALGELEELPQPIAMEGWFADAEGPLRVAAVEVPDARLIVVRDPTTVDRLASMTPELDRLRKKARGGSGRRRPLDGFGDDVGIWTLSPEPVHPTGRSRSTLLFPFSERPTPGPKGVVEAAAGRTPGSLLGGPLMLSDAVAMAGIRAAEGNGRRVVILLLGGSREDGSRFAPGEARTFLAELNVPLFVWDLSGPAADPPDGWGDIRPVDSVDDLLRAVRRVRYRLSEQRIVWLSGRLLPQEISLTEAAGGVEFAR